MKLTAYTDYALRVLMHAGLHEGELVRVADIAGTFGISHNHLTKVVHQLGARGYLQTVQGRNGGVRLARAPESIIVGEVVRDFEEGLDLVECFDQKQCACRIQPACVLKNALDEALEAFLDKLDAITLADLLMPGRRLRSLLAIGDPGAPLPRARGQPTA